MTCFLVCFAFLAILLCVMVDFAPETCFFALVMVGDFVDAPAIAEPVSRNAAAIIEAKSFFMLYLLSFYICAGVYKRQCHTRKRGSTFARSLPDRLVPGALPPPAGLNQIVSHAILRQAQNDTGSDGMASDDYVILRSGEGWRPRRKRYARGSPLEAGFHLPTRWRAMTRRWICWVPS